MAPSTGTGISVAERVCFRFAWVMGTTLGGLRMPHARLIYRTGIQSFSHEFPVLRELDEPCACIVPRAERWMEWPRKDA
jgi:hypothetical protein